MRRIEALACELTRLLAVEVRYERLKYRPREQMAVGGELLAAAERVRVAGRDALPMLDADTRRAVSAARSWRASRAAIVDALAAVGEALSRMDEGPPTPRDLDDTAMGEP